MMSTFLSGASSDCDRYRRIVNMPIANALRYTKHKKKNECVKTTDTAGCGTETINDP